MIKKSSSYNQILRATSIFGSSQIVNILLGIVRTKIIALLLGVVGVGLIGIYQTVVDMLRTIGGLGFETGAVKGIAQSEEEEQAKWIYIFNRIFLFTAILAAALGILFCIPFSHWMFGNSEHALHIALLSIAVFFTVITLGRNSILQGLRKISFLAKSAIMQSVIGLVAILPIYYMWGVDGIIPAFILNSIILFFCANHYYRKLKIVKVETLSQDVFNKGLYAFKLGIFILLGSIIASISMFLIRMYVMHELDEYAVGIFQSAWSLTTVFTGLILGATGADYFPRLCAIEQDNDGLKKLVKEQLYIVLIISLPIAMAMLLFSNLALHLFYSSAFAEAQSILQWQIAGAFLKIAATPFAMILLAKHRGVLYLISELLFFVVYLFISYLYLPQLGVEATGMAYLVAYLVYMIFILITIKQIMSFKWSGATLVLMIVNLLLLAIGFWLTRIDTSYLVAYKIGLLALAIGFSYYMLSRIFSFAEFRNWFIKK